MQRIVCNVSLTTFHDAARCRTPRSRLIRPGLWSDACRRMPRWLRRNSYDRHHSGDVGLLTLAKRRQQGMLPMSGTFRFT